MDAKQARELTNKRIEFENNIKHIFNDLDKKITYDSMKGNSYIVVSFREEYRVRIINDLLELGYNTEVLDKNIYNPQHYFINMKISW